MAVVDYVSVAVGLGAILLGLGFVLTGVQHHREGGRIEGAPLTPIEDLEPGPVAVEGTARPTDDGSVQTPFSGREALAVEYRLREAMGKNRQTPTKLAEGDERVPFYVDDGTGRVLVRPEAADLELEREEEFRVPRDERPPEPAERFLARRADIGDPTEPAMGALQPTVGTRYFREWLLEPGEEVYVFGKATHEQGSEFEEGDLEICEGAAGGHPNPTTFVVADRGEAEVAGGHRSGGRLAVVLGLALVAIGTAFVFGSSLV